MARQPGRTYPSDDRRYFRVTEDLARRVEDNDVLATLIRLFAELNAQKAHLNGGFIRLSPSLRRHLTQNGHQKYADAIFERALKEVSATSRRGLGDVSENSTKGRGDVWLVTIENWLQYQRSSPKHPTKSPSPTPTPTPSSTDTGVEYGSQAEFHKPIPQPIFERLRTHAGKLWPRLAVQGVPRKYVPAVNEALGNGYTAAELCACLDEAHRQGKDVGFAFNVLVRNGWTPPKAEGPRRSPDPAKCGCCGDLIVNGECARCATGHHEACANGKKPARVADRVSQLLAGMTVGTA